MPRMSLAARQLQLRDRINSETQQAKGFRRELDKMRGRINARRLRRRHLLRLLHNSEAIELMVKESLLLTNALMPCPLQPAVKYLHDVLSPTMRELIIAVNAELRPTA